MVLNEVRFFFVILSKTTLANSKVLHLAFSIQINQSNSDVHIREHDHLL
jgi:hypothetical protein